jgi:chemotaxis protein histidine kinase CheA
MRRDKGMRYSAPMNGFLIALCVLLAAVVAGWGLAGLRSRRSATLQDGEECDDELRGVFLAEAHATLANLQCDVAQWRQAPENLERVVPLRRGFHTLKGSGLLVGATALGELSGKIEKLVLRVIDRELPPQTEVIEVVAAAVSVLPSLVAEFAGAGRSANLSPVLSAAERFLRMPGKPQRATSPARQH